MKTTLVIGSAVCDILIPVDHLPSRSEDINIYTQDMSLGGCAFNVCDCLRHFGVSYIPFLPVGSGIYGRFVKEQLLLRGIVSACPESEAVSGCCYCLVEPDGERTFLCYHGAEYLFEDGWFEALENSPRADEIGSVYVCGLEIEEGTGERVLAYLERHPDYRIFFAPSARICKIQPDRMNRMLALHPVLHLNEDEALRFTGCSAVEEAGRKLMDMTGNTVLITLGAQGCLIFEYDTVIKTDPCPVAHKEDTIGAGDSHSGSVIALLQKGCSMEEAVQGANRVAAQVVGTRGALLSDDMFANTVWPDVKKLSESL